MHVLVRFSHGLGDAVQLTCVLQHLAKHRSGGPVIPETDQSPAIRSNILVKGGTTAEIIGKEVVESYGGRVIRHAEVPGISTTSSLATLAFDRELQPTPVDAASCGFPAQQSAMFPA
jgi:hypothetical protein